MGYAYKGKRCKECWWYECFTGLWTTHRCCWEDAEGTPLSSPDEKACKRFKPKETTKN